MPESSADPSPRAPTVQAGARVGARGLLVLVAILVAALVAVLGVALGRGLWLGLLLLLLAALAAGYRPLGGTSLGFGAAVLPTAIGRLGVTVTVLLAVAAAVAGHALDRRLWRHRPTAAAGITPWSAMLTGIQVLVGTLGGALVVWLMGTRSAPASGSGPPSSIFTSPALTALLPALVYAALAAAALLAARRLLAAADRFDALDAAARRALTPMPLPILVDAMGWWLGMMLAALAWPTAWPLLAAVTLLAAEAARQGAERRRVARQADDLERLQDAHRRILSETSGMAGIATQFLVECENVVPLDTFQLEIVDQATESRRSFVAGAERMLGEGEPSPPAAPPMLPGVHKRVSWHIVEHALDARDEGGGLLGTLRLWCDPRLLEPRDEALLATLIPHLSSSLHRAHLDREAKHDPLTGVLVRRVLERRLQEVYRAACEEGQPMAVILCDIDHFKRVNDTWGHDAGDQALIAVAEALDAGRREDDLLCRYGGEEFTLLLEAASGEEALHVAERLRRGVEALEVVYDGQRLPLRLSAGVAAFPELHVKTGSELLLLADEALYAAKEKGRNRCLLNLGRTRYVGSDGQTYGDATPTPPRVPRLFR